MLTHPFLFLSPRLRPLAITAWLYALLFATDAFAGDIIVVTDRRHPVRVELPSVRVIELDAAQRIEAELAANLPQDPARAAIIVQQRLREGGTALQQRINEAYQRLKDPLRRASYLCELNGAPINAENNTAMPHDFLVQQMQWREALDDAETTEDFEEIASQSLSSMRKQLSKIEQLLDVEKDFPAAAQQVRSLMFIERFASEVDARIDQLGQ